MALLAYDIRPAIFWQHKSQPHKACIHLDTVNTALSFERKFAQPIHTWWLEAALMSSRPVIWKSIALAGHIQAEQRLADIGEA